MVFSRSAYVVACIRIPFLYSMGKSPSMCTPTCCLSSAKALGAFVIVSKAALLCVSHLTSLGCVPRAGTAELYGSKHSLGLGCLFNGMFEVSQLLHVARFCSLHIL